MELRPQIKSLIDGVARRRGFTDYVIADVSTNQKGEGYLGEIFTVTVKDAGARLGLVVKAAFTEDKVRAMAPIRLSFENEICFYQRVNPALEAFAKERGAQEPPLVPRCFAASAEEGAEMLALEDLKSAGFEVFDKTLVLDEDHVGLIFRTYGRFHALSFALRDQRPEEYAGLAGGLRNVYEEFTKQDFFCDYFGEMVKLAASGLIEGEDDEVIGKFEKYSGHNAANIFKNIAIQECDYPAILHGDCWSNNMLFKYETTDQHKKLTEMRLIDWQIIKVGSPVCDLSYCLYSGASKKVFDNLNDYLKIYHDSLSSTLRKLGSDPEKLFPFEVLKEEWRKFSKFGLIMALGIIRMKLTHKEDIVDLRDGFEMEELVNVFSETKFDEEDYHKRIRGLLWHMNEIGAL